MNLKRKFQQGGPVGPDAGVAPESAPMDNGGQDPMAQIVQLFIAGLQEQNCEALAQGAEMFLQLVQQAQGGAEPAPEGQPVFAKGGKLVSRKQAQLQLVYR